MGEIVVERFRAQCDDGYETEIIVYQQIVDIATRGDPHDATKGMKSARTIDGYAAEPVDPTSAASNAWKITTDPLHRNRIVHRIS